MQARQTHTHTQKHSSNCWRTKKSFLCSFLLVLNNHLIKVMPASVLASANCKQTCTLLCCCCCCCRYSVAAWSKFSTKVFEQESGLNASRIRSQLIDIRLADGDVKIATALISIEIVQMVPIHVNACTAYVYIGCHASLSTATTARGRHLKWKSSGNKDMHIFLPCVDFPFTFHTPLAYFSHICLSSEMHATTAATTPPTTTTCRWATCCSLTAVKKKLAVSGAQTRRQNWLRCCWQKECNTFRYKC